MATEAEEQFTVLVEIKRLIRAFFTRVHLLSHIGMGFLASVWSLRMRSRRYR